VSVEFTEVVDAVGKGVDAVGVAVIVVGAFAATVIAALRLRRRGRPVYQPYRQQLGRSILLGLEFLVAADIIRTVAITPTFTSVGVLAGIVLIRTFLSFALELEITGRWPWDKRDGAPTSSETSPPVRRTRP
jgi:uncharacterized membrane protein